VTTTNVCPRCSARDAMRSTTLPRPLALLLILWQNPHSLSPELLAEANRLVEEDRWLSPNRLDRLLDDVQAAPTLEGRIAGTAAVAHEDDAGDEWATRERPDRFEVL
jgi:hypothetical protein